MNTAPGRGEDFLLRRNGSMQLVGGESMKLILGVNGFYLSLPSLTFFPGDGPRFNRMNIWEGEFPKGNTLKDGYLGPAPVKSFPPNDYGLYNMLGKGSLSNFILPKMMVILGNVWEWVTGGDPQHRILRGGSFLDSSDGRFNHIVIVSTKQVNPGDSGASNIGFRCAGKYVEPKLREDKAQDNEEL